MPQPNDLKNLNEPELKDAFHRTSDAGLIEEHRAVAEDIKRRDANSRRAKPLI